MYFSKDVGLRALDQRSEGVDVTFEHTTSRRFDVVIGADSLHSVMRKLCFGSEDQPNTVCSLP